MIRIQDVHRSFGQTEALAGVTVSATRGEVLGLLGPNGAGKTTLIRILATLLAPDSGTVRVGGHDVATDPAAVRSLIGLAGQLAAVDDLLTGRENLDLVGRLYGLGTAERRRRTDDVLAWVGLADVAGHLVRTYSGGMRRRLDLAATLVGRPAVLLLDEPTTGLDPRSRVEVWRRVQELADDGATVVLTSQQLDEVERLAHRIVVLDRGRVIASGTADDLKRRVGGDVLEVCVSDEADLDLARRALVDGHEGHDGSLGGDGGAPAAGGLVKVEEGLRRVTMPTREGTAALVAAGRRLESAGVALDDLGIRRPSLDDVFFSLTGGDGPPEGDSPPGSAGPPEGDSPPGAAPAPTRRAAAPADQTRPPAPTSIPPQHEPPPRPDPVRAPQPPHTPAPTSGPPRDQPPQPLPPEQPPTVTRRHSGVGDAAAITGRALRRLWRTPQLLFFGLVQPVMFVITLGPVFGRMVERQTGNHYPQYLLPGVLVMCVALAAGATGVALAEDLQSGAVDRFRSLPMARHALLVGRTVADLCRNAAASALVVVASVLLGFRFERGVVRGAAAFGLVLLFGFALSWVFAAVGLAVRDVQTAQFLGFAPVLPLVFLSGAWIPVEVMAGGLQAFARHQPVNVTLEAVRSLVDHGADTGTWVVRSLLWSGAILAVFARLAVVSYRRSSG